MATNVQRTRLAIAAESGGFGVDPDATGAAYLWVRLFGGSTPLLEDLTTVLETDYWTGRNSTTPAERGNDGATLNFEIPAIGFPAAVGSGSSPPANDWLDTILDNMFGASTSVQGAAVSASTGTTLTTGTSPFGLQDLLAVQDAASNGGIMQWRRSSSAASPYTVNRAWDANPTATAIARGYKRWTFLDPGGLSLAGVYDLDGTQYSIGGGRVHAAKLMLPAGQLAKWQLSSRWNTKVQASHASLPSLTAWTGTPIKGQLADVAWGSSAFAMKSVEIDFGLIGSDDESVAGAQGRANIENMMSTPILTLTPRFATSWETDFRIGTTRTLLVRYGSGALASGAVNSIGFFAENAEVIGHKLMNDGRRIRQTIQLKVRDGGIFSGSTASRLWQLART